MSSSTLVLSNQHEIRLREDLCNLLHYSELSHNDQLDIFARLSMSNNVRYDIDELVIQGKITNYQAQELLAGRADGLILGPHTIIDEIGFGGFGKVYKAYHRLMNRIVALKVITPKLIDDPDIRELFLREVIASARLQHPNLASVYYANEEHKTLYYAMEYIDGPDLEAWLERNGPLPVLFAIQAMIQAASGLDYLSKQGMVHRDIKPANILLPNSNLKLDKLASVTDNPSLVKIIDFGLARLRPRGTPNSMTIRQEAELVGTPRYIAPEQALDFHNVDIRSDIYSLGCTFYRILSGEYAFDADSTMQIIQMHHHHHAKPLQQLRPDIPPRLTQIIARMMAKKPVDRYQTPQAIIDDLDSLNQSLLYHSHQSACRLLGHQQESSRSSEVIQYAELLTPIQGQACAFGSLHSLWQHWRSLTVAVFSQQAVGDEDYNFAYHQLVQALRGPIIDWPADTVSQHQVLEIVEPWVSLHALLASDRATIKQLVEHTNLLSTTLWPVDRPSTLMLRLMIVGIILICMASMMYLVTHYS